MSQLKISYYFQATHARELLNTSFGSSVSTASTSSSLTSHSSNSSSSKDLNLELNNSSSSLSTLDENFPSCSQQSSSIERSTLSQESNSGILNSEPESNSIAKNKIPLDFNFKFNFNLFYFRQ
jgi:hypothetical protein